MIETPDRNLAFDLAHVTETAAMASARWQGRGDKEGVDRAAVDAMRAILASVDIDGVVVIGEGEKDEAPMLFNGEMVGNGTGPKMDIAVDPIDGTTLSAQGMPGALAVIAMAERGSMYSPGSVVYMDKIAVGPRAAGTIYLDAPVEDNLHAVADARGKDINDLTAIILDRPRNEKYIEAVRRVGGRIRLIRDGDISGAIATADDATGIDILLGIGGSPEAVIAAAALACMGGEIQARLWPRDDSERQYALENGLDLDAVLTQRDLVRSDNVFFAATGVTTGEFLQGVEFFGDGARTHSVVMRSKTGSVRSMHARHDFAKLRAISAVVYD
jgi:fructose-1,6-bisphosphatase II